MTGALRRHQHLMPTPGETGMPNLEELSPLPPLLQIKPIPVDAKVEGMLFCRSDKEEKAWVYWKP